MTDPRDPARETPVERLMEPGPPPLRVSPTPAGESELIRHRQRGAARMTGLALAALAILIFLITVAKQVR